MTNYRKKGIKTVLTIMADDGIGTFLWKKDSDEVDSPGVGYGYLDRDQTDCNDCMSKGLYEQFSDWMRKYDEAKTSVYRESGPFPDDWDWELFNDEGIQLARCLRMEHGADTLIRYWSPDWDPVKNEGEPKVYVFEYQKAL